MRTLFSIIFSFVALVAILTCPQRGQAQVVLDANSFYYSDALTTSSSANVNRLFYNLFLGFALDKKAFYQLGWSYANFSATDEDGTTSREYSSTQMGPGFIFYLDKARTWRVGLYYHLKVEGEYAVTGSATQEWRGSAYAGDIGYQVLLGPSLSMAARINYSSSAFNESFESTTKTDISYSRALIYPSLALTLEF